MDVQIIIIVQIFKSQCQPEWDVGDDFPFESTTHGMIHMFKVIIVEVCACYL